MPGRLIGLPICSTTIVFLSVVLAMFRYLSALPADLSLGLAGALAGAVSAARHDLAHLLAAPGRYAARAVLMAERIESGAHHRASPGLGLSLARALAAAVSAAR